MMTSFPTPQTVVFASLSAFGWLLKKKDYRVSKNNVSTDDVIIGQF